ncbi:hypothetical protein PMKS-001394 [Pichia membranifaciens]|uniref:Uncharacterized protein n=1 Tax=Pichia membranifaciens TaxID=4926 RepID=A0A1Q2YED9_9ASCO|nr:hypothetical protein PMKS-001394 [Pichia membranifaciens]
MQGMFVVDVEDKKAGELEQRSKQDASGDAELVDDQTGKEASDGRPDNQGVIVVAGRPRVDGPLSAGAGSTGTGARGCYQRAVEVVVSAEHRQEVSERLVAEDGDGLFLLELEAELCSQDEEEVALKDVVPVEDHNTEDEERDAALNDG